MSATASATPDGYNRGRLFIVGVLALFAAAFALSMRGAISGDLKSQFLDPLGIDTAGQSLGAILGAGFLGFAFTLALTSPFADQIGLGRLAALSSIALTLGSLLLVFAEPLIGAFGGETATFLVLYGSVFLAGIGWGAAESFTNPMTATLYPEDKVHRLNVLHAWWPAGLVVGGLAGAAYGQFGAQAGLSWHVPMIVAVLPAIAFGVLSLGQKFPHTEAKVLNVSFGDMIAEVFRRPLFFVFFFAMFLTAAAELAPGQWVQIALTEVVGMQGILLLAYISAIMFVARHFAGPIERLLGGDISLLWVSCLLAAIGLYLLSIANSPVTALVAATVWGVGVCFMWPTMLGAVAHRFPRGGAWALGLIGSAGALAIQFVLPAMGRIYDQAQLEKAGGPEALQIALAQGGPERAEILAFAAERSFQAVALLPAVLLVVFGILWVFNRKPKQPAGSDAVEATGL